MNFMFWVWLGVIAVTAIIEFMTLSLTSIWFTAGAIVPLIMAIFNVRWEIQVAVYVVVSIVLVVSLRKVTRRFLLKNAKEKTNLDSLVGKQFKLIDPIDGQNDTGTIKVNGVVWSVVSQDEKPIASGERVEIIEVSGNKFVVKQVVQKVQQSAEQKVKEVQ